MDHATRHPPLTGRHAVVRLRNGNTYVGEVVCTDRLVTIDGSLRVAELTARGCIFTYRPRRHRTLSVSAVEQILWDDE